MRLTKDEWGAFFNSTGWKLFAEFIESGIQDAYTDLKESDGASLYRAQGVHQALDQVVKFQRDRLEDIYEGIPPEPTNEELREHVEED